MKRNIFTIAIVVLSLHLFSQTEFKNLYPDDIITEVQPMTGIVFWDDIEEDNSDAISLEFSYMLFNDIVTDAGVYNWDEAENKLEAIASRNHQAIFRFRYVYPGYKTSVPDYIKERDDYEETEGRSEGKKTYFPDWTNDELKRFTLEFYTKFAERYDNDPRLAFIQVGFGLWAEYHIYSGPFKLGETFPSKEFQETFFYHLDSTFINIPWSISIDAADDTYTPFVAKPELKEIRFGLFDDSFMHENHSGYNTSSWNFFDRERYRTSPAGGEFSYYTNYDQRHVLDYPGGPYGKTYESFAKSFHISYMIGNDQPEYQTMQRIKDVSMASGYKFKIVSLKTTTDTSVFEILNYGVAPIYYDAFIAVDGVRSPQSLKLLSPGDTLTCSVSKGAEGGEITIESDKLLDGQEIQFYGTQELPITVVEELDKGKQELLYPNPVNKGSAVFFSGKNSGKPVKYYVYSCLGQLELSGWSELQEVSIETSALNNGLHLIKVEQDSEISTGRLLVL